MIGREGNFSLYLADEREREREREFGREEKRERERSFICDWLVDEGLKSARERESGQMSYV